MRDGQRNGGKILVESLQALGARHSFGVPGESYLAVLDALYDTKGALDFTLCRNEGGAGFMAAAYGKLTGTPGICFVTRGPGAMNASIAVHTAMQDSVPMLLFVGQVGTDMKGREAFQEVDYCAVFGTMAKWVVEIEDVDRLPEFISRAWTTAMSGRPGPVVVALPEDMLTAESSVEPLTGPVTTCEAGPSDATVQAVLAEIKTAERPLVLIGGSGWSVQGREAVQQFAERSNLPVLAAFRFQDLYDNNVPTYVGDAGVGMTAKTKELVRQADVILAINIRFGEMTTDGFTLLNVPSPDQKLIHVHSSDRELGKVYRPDIAIHSGPNAFCAALKPHQVDGNWGGWRGDARAAYEAGFSLPDLDSPVDMGKVTAFLRDRLPGDAILTNGAGNFTVWPNKFFKFGADQRLLAPQSGAMGYGVPAAIAAKVAQPERTVVCFAGDGDFQMNCQELGTAMQAGAMPIILILNNGIYGTIRMHQERNYPDRISGTSLENPNFVDLARSYGFHAERVEKTDDFEAAFERAMASKCGAVLELNISAEALTPRQTLTQMRMIAKGDTL
ncbi:thiamine pyrophosphate-binding protein [Halocynthiibacter namhaensis]|uniref:thiamine pyrophosphate-binding protein n=1 Tax=Halocynthiibacter namhaensis TaxID=1290553 RepID=UPI0005796748|nr:thiamine pyrophosphate-binding protein [Halocynthiibacter namhaensis]